MGEEFAIELFSLETEPRKIIYKELQRNTRQFGSLEFGGI